LDADVALGIGVFAAGAVAVRGALIWRARERQLRVLAASLTAPDPHRRAAAGDALARLGLDRVGQILLAHVRVENDPEVRRAIALAVARRQWEPASLSHVAELRQWAAGEFGDAGVPVEGFAPTPMRLGEGDHIQAPARPDPVRARPEVSRPPMPDPRRTAAVVGASPGAPPDRTRRVLVTGAGGAAGIAVIRELKQRGEPVVAADADPMAAGLALADDHAVIAPASDKAFVEKLCRAVTRLGADAVVCTVAEEMLVIAGREDELVRAGAEIWLSPGSSVMACVDKWEFACAMHDAGIPVPPTSLRAKAGRLPGPWIVKPRFGRGSRDVYAVYSRPQMCAVLDRVADPIFQTRIAGREFTVDVLIDRHGVVAGAVPRWRLETKAGISTKGSTFDDPDVIETASAAAVCLGLEGAVNVQGFVDGRGRVWIIEVNPRVSGGLSLTQAAGADIVGELVRGTRRELIRPERLRFEAGVTMRRYFEEVIS
jgi:carbamoyl-phosphate synthase large subunit